MDVLSLAVPLTALLDLTNLCASAFASLPRFALGAGACLPPLLAGTFGEAAVVFAHGSGFPFTDTTSHKLGTVGFSDVAAFNEDIEHAHVPPIVIHLKLAALEPTEEARADVPATLKREPVSLRDAIPMMGGLAIDSLHQQQFEIIGRAQILGHSTLRHRLLPEHRATLPSQLVPGLLVIIHDGLIETALQFFQGHASRLGGSSSVMH